MTLRNKIVTSFVLSGFIMAALILSGYLNFVEIRKEIRFLELSDTIRSKTLQLRRHEKNYLLFRDRKELASVYNYLKEIDSILNENYTSERGARLRELGFIVGRYGQTFKNIEGLSAEFHKELNEAGMARGRGPGDRPRAGAKQDPGDRGNHTLNLIESAAMENPLLSAEVLKESYSLPGNHVLIRKLAGMDSEIKALRSLGEVMIAFSKEVDKTAREKVDMAMYFLQATMLFALPLLLFVSFGISLLISRGIVKRLDVLTKAVEKTAEGSYTLVSGLPKVKGADEVDVLIMKFNTMEGQLEKREKELLESKKLAAIGTLASGVAHELNNPLSNIYTTAQRLKKKAGDECPPFISKGLDDIFGQTLRVKKIVGELLEFSRDRPLELGKVNIVGLMLDVLDRMTASGEMGSVKPVFHATEDIMTPAEIDADRHLMEQVFINLFANAADAMEGKGLLELAVDAPEDNIRITVADTGKGIPQKDIQRIFEPFFTTKDKGTGLGLAIAYNIVAKHGGSIHVKSEEGKGAAFIITLPLKKT